MVAMVLHPFAPLVHRLRGRLLLHRGESLAGPAVGLGRSGDDRLQAFIVQIAFVDGPALPLEPGDGLASSLLGDLPHALLASQGQTPAHRGEGTTVVGVHAIHGPVVALQRGVEVAQRREATPEVAQTAVALLVVVAERGPDEAQQGPHLLATLAHVVERRTGIAACTLERVEGLGDLLPADARHLGSDLATGPDPEGHACSPSPTASRIAATKAGRSPGSREVIRLPSTTTSRSTHSAPALTRSSRIDG